MSHVRIDGETESVAFTEEGDCDMCGCKDGEPCGHFDCKCWHPSHG